MATDKPISGFPLITGTDLEPGDLFVIVDVSNTSSAPTGTTSSVALSSVLNNPQNGIVTGKLVPIRAVASSGQIVNTSQNGIVLQSTGGTLTDFAFLSSTGTQIAAMRASDSALIGGKLMGVSVAPTIVVSANAGSGATATVVGSDSAGLITLTTGTSVLAGNVMCTLTFSNPYSNGISGNVSYSFPDPGTAAPMLACSCSATQLQVATLTATPLTDSRTYLINYQVMGYGN